MALENGEGQRQLLKQLMHEWAPKAKGPALKSLEELICGINCPWTPVLMDGRDGAPVRVTVAKAAQLCDLRRKTIWPKPIIS